jgi:dTDP-6-deoxy-L-talose 4-dehydrogenase (NAD+)
MDNPTDCFSRMGRPDCLIHLAWQGLPNYESRDHLIHLETQYEFLHRAIGGGLKSLLVSGSCAEYGKQSGELKEDMPTLPNTPYAKAKDSLRKRLEALQAERHFDLTWLRIFYVRGERGIFGALKKAAERGDETFPMTGGKQVRDFVPDWQVAQSIVQLTGTDSGIVNVCSTSKEHYPLKSWIETAIAIHGWKIRPEYGALPYLDYEPMEFWGNPEKMLQLTQIYA